jgi:hypothetical protein
MKCGIYKSIYLLDSQSTYSCLAEEALTLSRTFFPNWDFEEKRNEVVMNGEGVRNAPFCVFLSLKRRGRAAIGAQR